MNQRSDNAVVIAKRRAIGSFLGSRAVAVAGSALVICACAASLSHAQSSADKPTYRKLDSTLNQLVISRAAAARGESRIPGAVQPSLRQLGLLEFGSGRVGVTIRFGGSGEAIREFLATRNGHIAYSFDGAIEAYVEPAFLPGLDALVEVDRVDVTARAEPQVTSQGVQVHNAAPWQVANYLGQGVRVGIIDVGFMGWASLPSADLPSVGGVRCYTGGGLYTTNFASCQTITHHGTGVAEAAHDIAPGATFYLANVNTTGDLHDAVQWMIQQGVRVINMSLSFNWDGPGNGTSPYPDSPLRAVDLAVAGGAVFVVSSGNYGESAWFGPWQDPNADEYLEFDASNDFSCLWAESSEQIGVELRWQDSWGGATRDLDLGLYDLTSGALVAQGSDYQAGGAWDVPHESLSYLPIFSGYYCLAVHRYSGSIPSWVQFRVRSGQTPDVRNPATSITNPAETASPGALAVGAANWQTPSTIEVFSSRGPTPDGRTKPEIVGVDRADSYTYGPNGFAGTSQASPHVAGLVAILAGGYASDTPSQLATRLKNWAQPRGGAPNNTWGYGLAYLPTVYNLTVSRIGSGAGTVTSLDGGVNCGSDCVNTYFAGNAVTLAATPATGSIFAGWTGGGCTGTGTCTTTMTAATTVTATFTAIGLQITISPSSGPMAGGTAVTITGANFVGGATSVTFGGTPAASVNVTSPTSLIAVTPAKPAGFTAVVVTTADGMGTGGFTFVGPPPAGAVRYFAEGANGEGLGFQTRLALMNPHESATAVTLEFSTTTGAQVAYGPLNLGAHQRRTVDTWTDVAGLANASFSTTVRSSLSVVADRTMRWDGTGYASHAETAIVSPSTTWYVAEGATHSGFRLFYLLQNPHDVASTVRVTYLLTGQSPVTATCRIPARTRKNIYANVQLCPDDIYLGVRPSPSRLDANDVSTVFEVTNGVPIIVERAMYRGPGFAAGTAAAGVTSPATQWFLAEGATGDLFDTYLLLANPSGTDAEFDLDLLRLNAAPSLMSPTMINDPFFCAPAAAPCPLVVPAHERRTIRLDGIPGAENDGVSSVVRVTNGVAVLVERAMWWPGPYATWTEGHASFGTTATGTRWGLAEGEVGGPRAMATYVLVANTSGFDALVRATLVFEDGTTAATDLTVAANSRANFNFTPGTIAGYPELTELFPPATVAAGKRFGVIVESLPTGWGTAQLVVERAMYGGDGRSPTFLPYWPAGTNAVGTRLQ